MRVTNYPQAEWPETRFVISQRLWGGNPGAASLGPPGQSFPWLRRLGPPWGRTDRPAHPRGAGESAACGLSAQVLAQVLASCWASCPSAPGHVDTSTEHLMTALASSEGGRETERERGGELQGGGHGLRSLLSESPCRKRVTGCRPRTRGGDYTSHVWRQDQNQTSEWLLRVLIPLGVNILMFCYKNVNGFNLRGCPRPRQKDYVIYSRHTF